MIFPIALTTNSCDCAMSEPNTIHGLHQIRTTPNASLLAAKCTRTSTQIRGEFTSCDPGRPTAIPDRSLSGTVPSGLTKRSRRGGGRKERCSTRASTVPALVVFLHALMMMPPTPPCTHERQTETNHATERNSRAVPRRNEPAKPWRPERDSLRSELRPLAVAERRTTHTDGGWTPAPPMRRQPLVSRPVPTRGRRAPPHRPTLEHDLRIELATIQCGRAQHLPAKRESRCYLPMLRRNSGQSEKDDASGSGSETKIKED
jgi:hypothetical protein